MIVSQLQKYPVIELQGLLHVSLAIAGQVRAMYQTWGSETAPSVYAYRGDVYKGFYADTLSMEDMNFAQDHLRIMSGLYGVLRPRDGISRYRLEMKAKVPIAGKETLYRFWGERLAQYVEAEANGVICVLSSVEYAKPVTTYVKNATIVTPVFMDHKPNGEVGPVPIYSKMMRGVMARWLIDNRVDDPEEFHKFTGHGYHFDAKRSTLAAPVFVRKVMKPLQF